MFTNHFFVLRETNSRPSVDVFGDDREGYLIFSRLVRPLNSIFAAVILGRTTGWKTPFASAFTIVEQYSTFDFTTLSFLICKTPGIRHTGNAIVQLFATARTHQKS